jgi:RES domain
MEYDPRKLLIFLQTLGGEFSKPIERDDRVHIEYLPTQVVTEYLRGMKTKEDASVDGIRYGSARHEGGASLVLFCNPNNLVLPEEQQDDWYDMHQDRWIKLIGYQDQDISAIDIAGWNAETPARP